MCACPHVIIHNKGSCSFLSALSTHDVRGAFVSSLSTHCVFQHAQHMHVCSSWTWANICKSTYMIFTHECGQRAIMTSFTALTLIWPWRCRCTECTTHGFSWLSKPCTQHNTRKACWACVLFVPSSLALIRQSCTHQGEFRFPIPRPYFWCMHDCFASFWALKQHPVQGQGILQHAPSPCVTIFCINLMLHLHALNPEP